jgi:hypothetical protein
VVNSLCCSKRTKPVPISCCVKASRSRDGLQPARIRQRQKAPLLAIRSMARRKRATSSLLSAVPVVLLQGTREVRGDDNQYLVAANSSTITIARRACVRIWQTRLPSPC